MMPIKELSLIALAGAVGTVARVMVAGWVQKIGGQRFPWGTLAVNLIGCFLFGLVFALAAERALISPRWRVVLLGGFMGAFTTFSTFGSETAMLLRQEQWAVAFANIAAQNILGIAAVFLGIALGRSL
jgi:CrcB protein